MQHSSDFKPRATAIARLFEESFAASEGAEEGALIGELAGDLMSNTPAADLFVFITLQDDDPIGATIYSRLHAPNDHRTVFLLGPVAVATKEQGKGVGQSLLNFGLSELRRQGAHLAATYGDPGYYGKLGFQPVTTATVPAPLPLQYPEGWLAQSLTDTPLTPIRGPSHCVATLNHPGFW